MSNEHLCPAPPEVKNSYSDIQWTEESYRAYLQAVFAEKKNAYPIHLSVHYSCKVGSLFPQKTTSRTSVCQVFGEWSHIDDCEGNVFREYIFFYIINKNGM